jgi:hypothetical protein
MELENRVASGRCYVELVPRPKSGRVSQIAASSSSEWQVTGCELVASSAIELCSVGPLNLLFVAQGNAGIDTSGFQGGHESCQQRDER